MTVRFINLRGSGGGGGGGVTFDGTISVGDTCMRSGVATIGKETAIPEGFIVASQVLNSFSHNAGIQEKGMTLNNFVLSWTYNRNGDNPTSQSINQGIGAIPVAQRSYNVSGAGLIANTIYTISAVGDDGTNSSMQTTVQFQNKRYFGISNDPNLDNAGILALSSEFGTARQVLKTFDASQGTPPNYLYFAYPVAWGAPSSTKLNGFAFTDFTQSTIVGFINASGHAEDYYVLRTNNAYGGANITWEIL